MLGVCDAHYRFLYVDIGASGRRSDGGVFGNSSLCNLLERKLLNIPSPSPIVAGSNVNIPFVFLGDEAFPLKEYLMRPFPKKKLNLQRRIYNFRQARARRPIENSFGILASKWRIFRKPIIADLDTIKKIVKASVCLHNWLINEKNILQPEHNYIGPGLVDNIPNNGEMVDGSWRRVISTGFTDITRAGANNYNKRVAQIREYYVHYFNNEGAVPWQYDSI